MRFSHSKLSCILKCPMTYKLTYIDKIWKRSPKEALELGSAVHWGIEHNNCDLTEYYKENSSFFKEDKVSDQQKLAEIMVKGYFLHKEELFSKIVDCKVLDEFHEVELSAKLGDNEFMGIIDLLLFTEKGFVIIDYKTSSTSPDWNGYLDQIYRYIFLVEQNFPEIPIYSIGIINLRKTKIKQSKNETEIQFIRRLEDIYLKNDEKYLCSHRFELDKLNKQHQRDYVLNLEKMCNCAKYIVENKLWYINYSAVEDYGGTEQKELLLQTPGAYVLYNINDKYFNEDTNQIQDYREATPEDMNLIYDVKLLNKYKDFENLYKKDENIFEYLDKEGYIYNKKLIENYIIVYNLLSNDFTNKD